MITGGFQHVAVVAGDASRSRAFYRDVLGLGAGGPGTRVCVLDRAGSGQGRPGIGGIHHTAFGVAEEGALLMWKRRLTDLELAVSGPYDRGYFTSIYFRDPDGQILEIATAGPGYAIDEPVDRLGGELMIPPQRIVRGHRDEAAIRALTHAEPVPEIAPSMQLDGIHHISGITDDLSQAGEFYEAALGLRLIKKTTNRDDPDQLHYFWAVFEDGEIAPHTAFTLFGWPDHWHRARDGRGQTHHVAVRAREGQTLAEWEEHLHGVGAQPSRVEDDPHVLDFQAPDGQRLRIVAP